MIQNKSNLMQTQIHMSETPDCVILSYCTDKYRIMRDPHDFKNRKKFRAFVTVPVTDIPGQLIFCVSRAIDTPDIEPSDMIKMELISDSQMFHLKNKGILIIADKVHYDNRDNHVEITLNLSKGHGVVDGIKTLATIIEVNAENDDLPLHYVEFEVMVGLPDDFDLAQLRSMRNIT